MQGHATNLTGKPLKSLFPPKRHTKRNSGRMAPMDTLSSSPLRAPQQPYTQRTTPVRVVVPDEARPPYKAKRLDLTGDLVNERVLEPVALHHINLNGDKLKITFPGLSMSVHGGSLIIRSGKPHNFHLEIILEDIATVLVDETLHATNFVLKMMAPVLVEAGERKQNADTLWISGRENTEEELEQFYMILKEKNAHKVKYVSAEELRKPFPGLTPMSKKDFYGNDSSPTLLRRSTRIHNPSLSVADKISLLDSVRTPTKRGKPAVPDWHEEIPISKQIVFEPPLRFKFDDRSTFTVTNSDFKCLYNNFWINDTIIDFFLKYDLQKSVNEKRQISKYRVKLLNSYFYTKLASSQDCYENVKSWFKNENDLFANDLIVIPIVHNFHWLCVLVSGTKHIMNSTQTTIIADETDDEAENTQRVTLTVLDSLGGDRYPFTSPLRKFFIGYAQDKYNKELTPRDLKTKKLAVPRQRNFNDCGIHVIYNARRVFQDYGGFLELMKQSYKKVGKKLDKDFFSKDELMKLRPRLRGKLLDCLRDQVREEGGDAHKVGVMNNSEWKQMNKDTNHKDDADENDDDLQIIEEPVLSQSSSKENSAEPPEKQETASQPLFDVPPSSPPERPSAAIKSETESPTPTYKPESTDEMVISTHEGDIEDKGNDSVDLENSKDEAVELREDSNEFSQEPGPKEKNHSRSKDSESIDIQDMDSDEDLVESTDDTKRSGSVEFGRRLPKSSLEMYEPVEIVGSSNSKSSVIEVDEPSDEPVVEMIMNTARNTHGSGHNEAGLTKKRSLTYEGIQTRKRKLKTDTQLVIKGHQVDI